MVLNLTETLYALSNALDTVQMEMGGISNAHGKHVAVLSYLMGKYFSYDNIKLNDLVGLAILHDNAFTEYVREEYNGGKILDYNDLKIEDNASKLRIGFLNAPRHNVIGEENISLIPFSIDVKDILLYHHENANGTGPLHKKACETPILSQIIHISDMFDMMFDYNKFSLEEFNDTIIKMKSLTDILFSKEMVDAFINSITYPILKEVFDLGEINYLKKNLRSYKSNYTDDEIKGICEFFGKIIDYKSSVTKNHSLGVASKCEIMARYYGFDDDKRIRFYFAGAFHDIGKLLVTNDILEKPTSLTKSEYEIIQNHAYGTYKILSEIDGLDDICRWASRHHEKLNGTGYPFGLTASDLSFEDRLLAVIDIFQALIEKRSYKDEFSLKNTIDILNNMVKDNLIDGNIVSDIIKVFVK